MNRNRKSLGLLQVEAAKSSYQRDKEGSLYTFCEIIVDHATKFPHQLPAPHLCTSQYPYLCISRCTNILSCM